jgi:hypothetical protein
MAEDFREEERGVSALTVGAAVWAVVLCVVVVLLYAVHVGRAGRQAVPVDPAPSAARP